MMGIWPALACFGGDGRVDGIGWNCCMWPKNILEKTQRKVENNEKNR
jgi:hypothetical protein